MYRTVMRGIDLAHALQAEICRFLIGLGTQRLRLRHGGTPQPISTSVGGQTACRQCAAAFPSLNDIGGVDERTVVALEALEAHEMMTFDRDRKSARYQCKATD